MMYEYADTPEEALTLVDHYDDEVGRALTQVFMATSTRIESVQMLYYDLSECRISDWDAYLDNFWHNDSFSGGYAADAYMVALTIFYKLLHSDAFQNMTVPSEISYMEYEYAVQQFESMIFLLQYWMNWCDSEDGTEDIRSGLETLWVYNGLLLDIMQEFAEPYSSWDIEFYGLCSMASRTMADDAVV